MKINVAKKKFLLCFRPTIDAEPIELGNNNNNKHARRKVLFPKTSSTNHENGRTRKPSISRFFKNVLLGNGLVRVSSRSFSFSIMLVYVACGMINN